jgi:toxin ParE1/3/4
MLRLRIFWNNLTGTKVKQTVLAQRWEEAVTATLLRIAQRPGIGSRCRFTVDELRGTCRVPVAGFAKHLIFYQSREAEILVLRVVHGARDLESLF